MKRKLIKRLFTLVLGLSLLTGCYDGLLDQKPLDTVTSELFWSNYKDADAAINGMYSLMRASISGLTKAEVANSRRWGSWGDYFVYGDMRTGDWWTPNNDGDWRALMQNNLPTVAPIAKSFRTKSACLLNIRERNALKSGCGSTATTKAPSARKARL